MKVYIVLRSNEPDYGESIKEVYAREEDAKQRISELPNKPSYLYTYEEWEVE